jgi:hypothetical protein
MICQTLDMLHPSSPVALINAKSQISLADLLSNHLSAYIFLNYLTNVNKMLQFESRDPYEY